MPMQQSLPVLLPTSNYCVFGAGGFIGSHFARAKPGTLGMTRKHFDLSHFDLEKVPLTDETYALVTASMTNLVDCEDPRSDFVNVEQTVRLSEALLQRGITPVLFSTAYVFDGSKEFYVESDPVSPMNRYGAQKVEMEQRVSPECLILRIPKIYSLEPGQLIDQIVAPLKKGQDVQAATDQIFNPLYIQDLLNITFSLMEEKAKGIFHLGGPEIYSRYLLARRLAQRLGVDEALVHPISLDNLLAYPPRPKRLVIKTARERVFTHLTLLEEACQELA